MDSSDLEKTLASLNPEQVLLLKQILLKAEKLKNKESVNNNSEEPDTKNNKAEKTGKTQVNNEQIHAIPKATNADMNMMFEGLAEVLRLSALVGGEEQEQTLAMLKSIQDNVEDAQSQLKESRKELEERFVDSMKTVAKILKITGQKKVELELQVNKIFGQFQSGKFKSLEDSCKTCKDSNMNVLNEQMEQEILRLEPALRESMGELASKLKQFYDRVELVADEYKNADFLRKVPSREDVKSFEQQLGDSSAVKSLVLSSFGSLGQGAAKELAAETVKVEQIIRAKVQKVKQLQKNVESLSEELGESLEGVTLYKDDNELVKHLAESTEILQNLTDTYTAEKKTRQKKMDGLTEEVGKLWSILKDEDDSIQKFLKDNRNLRLESLENFERLLVELQQEKQTNMAKFIESSRNRIKGYWELLMYDETEQQAFLEYYVTDSSMYDDALLEAHSAYIERLRGEAENFKPVLASIQTLDGLLENKKQLEESSKDPSRLLRRDSFKILRREEKLRNRLSKELPAAIGRVRQKLEEYESKGQREFKVEGVPYLDKLEEIEQDIGVRRQRPKTRRAPVKTLKKEAADRGRSRNRSRSNSRSLTPLLGAFTGGESGARYRRTLSERRQVSQNLRSRASSVTSFTSMIEAPTKLAPRKLHRSLSLRSISKPSDNNATKTSRGSSSVPPSRCENPFIETTPRKKAKMNDGRSVNRSLFGSVPEKFLGSPKQSQFHSVSNQPVVIKGGSPLRHGKYGRTLNYATASKIPLKRPMETLPTAIPPGPHMVAPEPHGEDPVEELSDSLIYFSDDENENDKENQQPLEKGRTIRESSLPVLQRFV